LSKVTPLTPKAFAAGNSDAAGGQNPPLICFSHLRWAFVFQRPQHIMTRFARDRRVVFWEEPLPSQSGDASLDVRVCEQSGVMVATPRLPEGLSGGERDDELARLLDNLLLLEAIRNPVLWYYSPMMLAFSSKLEAAAVVYDCMDELSNFKFAPPELKEMEQALMAKADVVFTGGYSLYEAKRDLHANIHPFPSSVDWAHFAQAREELADQPDQAGLARPRIGFYGVIDERMDLELLAQVADARPDWQLVMVGPVVKISEEDLPRRPNIHYLGGKSYDQLPLYLAGWDAAMMPFAINEATRFISPTKTPEYIAGGRPVVSTPIKDVIRHYGELDCVKIAVNAEQFVQGCEEVLALRAGDDSWLEAADVELAKTSWESTFRRMSTLVAEAVAGRAVKSPPAIRPSDRKRPFDDLIVGAGFSGAVLAERLAAGSNRRVLVIDRRPHIGGNAYDHLNEDGLLIHKYGPHIFHTNSDEIFTYLSRFTRWRPYEHRVLAVVDNKQVPIPINRTTLNALYGLSLTSDAEAEAFLKSRAEPVEKIMTSEDVVISAVGRDLYEKFFRGYTRKQWGLDPSELDKSVTARIPTRTNTDDRYFTDTRQAMPLNGYTRMFENMLDHPNITVETGVDFEDIRGDTVFDRLIYSGPIDEYFDHRLGKLPYRSLEFRHETLDQEWFQQVGTVNYPAEDVPYTRITEYKHLTGQEHGKTAVTYEYPRAEGDPYYPVPRAENRALYKQYQALAEQERNTVFVGRLGTYQYYNMDQCVGQALATWRRLSGIKQGSTAEIGAQGGASKAQA